MTFISQHVKCTSTELGYTICKHKHFTLCKSCRHTDLVMSIWFFQTTVLVGCYHYLIWTFFPRINGPFHCPNELTHDYTLSFFEYFIISFVMFWSQLSLRYITTTTMKHSECIKVLYQSTSKVERFLRVNFHSFIRRAINRKRFHITVLIFPVNLEENENCDSYFVSFARTHKIKKSYLHLVVINVLNFSWTYSPSSELERFFSCIFSVHFTLIGEPANSKIAVSWFPVSSKVRFDSSRGEVGPVKRTEYTVLVYIRAAFYWLLNCSSHTHAAMASHEYTQETTVLVERSLQWMFIVTARHFSSRLLGLKISIDM